MPRALSSTASRQTRDLRPGLPVDLLVAGHVKKRMSCTEEERLDAEHIVVAADLELVKTDVLEPVMTGRYQLYQLTATNLGPDTAKAVVITDVLPAGTTLVVAEPTAACSEAGGVLTCAVRDLALGESFTATIMVYVDLTETPVPPDNMATVSSDTTDPVAGNNDVMETSEVILHAGLAALDDVGASGFPEVAVTLAGSIEVLVKDAESMVVLHQTEVFPDGWALAGFEKTPGISGGLDGVAVLAVEVATDAAEVRVVAGLDGAPISTSVVPAGFLPVTMTVIPDDGTARTLIAVGTVSLTGGLGRVFAFDASDGSLVAQFTLHPAAWPIGLAGVTSFGGGDSLAELGVLWVNTVNGGKRLQVKELTGATLSTRNLPIAMSPLALVRVADCCGGATDELAALGWDQLVDRARVRTVEADTGLLVQDGTFGNMAQPIALRSVPNVGGASADELATLFRNVALRAALRLRDAMTGANLLVKGYGPAAGSVPLGLGVAPNTYDTVVDDLAIYWLDPATGDLFVTMNDAGSGATVANVPIP